MTREEAIERMKIIKGDCYIIDNPKDKEAFDMSISALEQQPCDDAISRQAVLDGLKGCMCEDWVKTLFATMVKQLPSVTQKSGKWIIRDDLATVRYYQCSECNEIDLDISDYCPNCGAKMESEE